MIYLILRNWTGQIISLFYALTWKLIYIVIHSGWSLAWIFMKKGLRLPSSITRKQITLLHTHTNLTYLALLWPWKLRKHHQNIFNYLTCSCKYCSNLPSSAHMKGSCQSWRQQDRHQKYVPLNFTGLMENYAAPEQLVCSEASRSGSTLFSRVLEYSRNCVKKIC